MGGKEQDDKHCQGSGRKLLLLLLLLSYPFYTVTISCITFTPHTPTLIHAVFPTKPYNSSSSSLLRAVSVPLAPPDGLSLVDAGFERCQTKAVSFQQQQAQTSDDDSQSGDFDKLKVGKVKLGGPFAAEFALQEEEKNKPTRWGAKDHNYNDNGNAENRGDNRWGGKSGTSFRSPRVDNKRRERGGRGVSAVGEVDEEEEEEEVVFMNESAVASMNEWRQNELLPHVAHVWKTSGNAQEWLDGLDGSAHPSCPQKGLPQPRTNERRQRKKDSEEGEDEEAREEEEAAALFASNRWLLAQEELLVQREVKGERHEQRRRFMVDKARAKKADKPRERELGFGGDGVGGGRSESRPYHQDQQEQQQHEGHHRQQRQQQQQQDVPIKVQDILPQRFGSTLAISLRCPTAHPHLVLMLKVKILILLSVCGQLCVVAVCCQVMGYVQNRLCVCVCVFFFFLAFVQLIYLYDL
jgi:hypothetical protein